MQTMLLEKATSKINLWISPALEKAAKDHASAQGLTLSALVRLALAKEIEPERRAAPR